MDNRSGQTITSRAMALKNYGTPDQARTSANKASAPNKKDIKPVDVKLGIKPINRPIMSTSSEAIVSEERLQEAIIWSEILGKPVSKRGKRRV